MSGTFHELLFPTDISYGSSGGPKFKTTIFTANSGYEQRNINWSNVRCEYTANQGIKTQEQMDVLTDFFFNRQGKAFGFRFFDWNDYAITNQVIGTGDGATTAFQIVKTYTSSQDESGESYTFSRTLNKIAWDSVEEVQVGSVVLDPSTYTVDYNTGLITFATAPADNDIVSVGYAEFHVPVRFDTDQLDSTFEYQNVQNWTNIALIEVRDWQDTSLVVSSDNPPVWDTPSGSLGSVAIGGAVNVGLSAHDPDTGQGLSYSLVKGTLPPGVTLTPVGGLTGTVPLDGANVANYAFTIAVTDGVLSVNQDFSFTVTPLVLQFAANGSFTIPPNVGAIEVSWIIGGGAGGGEGSEVNYGGGGGGGGSGGYLHYQQLSVAHNDAFTVNIGAGGLGAKGASGSALGTATAGGATTLLQNGNQVLSVTGGQPGANNPSKSSATSTAAGGAGGTPNGVAGAIGPSGTADGASATGGAGGGVPISGSAGGTGGVPGGGASQTGTTAGQNGTGYGSGGGGGGSNDRGGADYWPGGNGSGGWLEVILPSQGATGGTAAA